MLRLKLQLFPGILLRLENFEDVGTCSSEIYVSKAVDPQTSQTKIVWPDFDP